MQANFQLFKIEEKNLSATVDTGKKQKLYCKLSFLGEKSGFFFVANNFFFETSVKFLD